MSEQQTIAKRVPTIKDRLSGPDFMVEVAKVLPQHLTAERFTKIALLALNKTPKLMHCDQMSFFTALMTLSEFGLEPDGRRAHLIPFRNSRKSNAAGKDVYDCQLIIDYKGITELMFRSGLVSSVAADVVCENDDFEYDRRVVVRHKIKFGEPRGKAIAYWAGVRFKDGAEVWDCMSMDDVDRIRKRSRASNDGPWVTDPNEMGKKTVLRRLSKYVPWSSEIRQAMEIDDDQFIDGELAAPPAGDKAPTLKGLSEVFETPKYEDEYPQTTAEPGEQPQSHPDAVDAPSTASEEVAPAQPLIPESAKIVEYGMANWNNFVHAILQVGEIQGVDEATISDMLKPLKLTALGGAKRESTLARKSTLEAAVKLGVKEALK
jgi:recombination protein RecT